MSDDKLKWDMPGHSKSAQLNEAGTLALKHGISPDRAQMLIDRIGHDPIALDAAASKLGKDSASKP